MNIQVEGDGVVAKIRESLLWSTLYTLIKSRQSKKI